MPGDERTRREETPMLDLIPALFLAAMIALTLWLLPLINEERKPERTGLTEEIHVRRDGPNAER
jgi:hypothetical protein